MRRGMTLIELLLAIALSSLLLFAAAAVVQASLNARERLQASSGRTGQVRRAWEMMSRDIHSAVVAPDDSGVQFGLEDGGAAGANVLQFASSVGEPLLAGRAANETVLIRYAIAEDPRNGRPTLWRYETPYPVPEGAQPSIDDGDTRALPMLDRVVAAAYLFFSPSQETWIETWDEAGLPTAIRVDLQLEEQTVEGEEPRQESWIFEVPAAGYANAQAEATSIAAEGAVE